MDPIMLARLIDLGFTMAEAGLARMDVNAKVDEMVSRGMTAEQIADELVKMRDAALSAAQDAISKAT